MAARKPAAAKRRESVSATPDDKSWPAYSIERTPIHELTPYARNSRIHSDEDVDKIARAVQEFGFTNPVLRDEDGTIIAGHARVMALAKLGYKFCPTIKAKGWTVAQKKAFVIWDNKSAQAGSWNEAVLKVELTDLKAAGYDVALTGFDSASIVSFLANGGGATQPPAAFGEVDENISTEHRCPACGYKWSGSSNADAANKDAPDAAVVADQGRRRNQRDAGKSRRGAGARNNG